MGSKISYKIDKEDLIVEIEGPWTEFLESKKTAKDLAPSQVISRSLWSFIQGETKALYQKLVAQVRNTQKPIDFQLRCDSPGIKRVIHLTISPEENGLIHFESETKQEEMRNPEDFLSAFQMNPLGRPIFMCSFCNKVRTEEGFIDLDEFVRRGAFDKDTDFTRYNCICKECDNRYSPFSRSMTDEEG